MSEHSRATAPPNLRITFWGVQGSCPVFPTPQEIDDYARRIALATIEKTMADLAGKFDRGQCDAAALRRLAEPRAAAEYQAQLGLPPLPVYGGDTTCVEVQTADGDIIVLDMGTGLRDFSVDLLSRANVGKRSLNVFATHEHLDHRAGFPFASVFFVRNEPFDVRVHAARGVLRAIDSRYGIFSRTIDDEMHVDDPLDYRMLAARFSATEIGGVGAPYPHAERQTPIDQSIMIGKTSVTPFEVYHGPTPCLGYKISHGGSTFVFCTDHELRHGPDDADPRQQKSMAAERRLIDHCRNADLAYFDGQYLRREYDGAQGIGAGSAVPRLDWGHSCIEDVIARSREAGVKRALVGHHDPERPYAGKIELDRMLREASDGKMELAKAGEVVEL